MVEVDDIKEEPKKLSVAEFELNKFKEQKRQDNIKRQLSKFRKQDTIFKTPKQMDIFREGETLFKQDKNKKGSLLGRKKKSLFSTKSTIL